MKKIVVNARFLTRKTTGVERYAFQILSSLLHDRRYQYILLAPRGELVQSIPDAMIVQDSSFLTGHLWEQLRLPSLCRVHKGDLLWSPCNTGPIAVKEQVVTIHDASVLACPECFSRRFVLYYRFLLRSLGRRVRMVLTDSEFSRAELIKYAVADATRIVSIHNGANTFGQGVRGEPASGSLAEILKSSYVLFVGSLEPRKNLTRLLEAWHKVRGRGLPEQTQLVIVGSDAAHFQKCSFAGIGLSSVRFVGRVTDGALRQLYEHARAFVYPSLYEGFGHPPLEAMACGCPVITSRAASLPEVCADAAMYFDPYSIDNIAETVYTVLANAGIRNELAKKGVQQVKRFSWEKCAQDTAAVFEKVLNS